MKLAELASQVGATLLTQGPPVSVEIERVYAGDRMSDLLNEASETTLLVTNLSTAHLLRMAELMDLPGICFVNGQMPEAEMVRTAAEHGTALMVSPFAMFETCGRLYQCLCQEGKRSP